jgi:hypothetical protein
VDTSNGVWRPYGDLDRDNLSNLEESLLGTDPTNGDTDGDGFGDGDEMTYRSDPLASSSLPADPHWRYTGAATTELSLQNNAAPLANASTRHASAMTVVVRNEATPLASPSAQHAHSFTITIQNDAPPLADGAAHAASHTISVRNDLP